MAGSDGGPGVPSRPAWCSAANPRRRRMKPGGAWSRLAAVVCLLLVLPMVAAAASKSSGSKKGVELPEPLTKDAIRELVSRLSDEEVRDLLLAQLDKAAAPAPSKSAETMAGGL